MKSTFKGHSDQINCLRLNGSLENATLLASGCEGGQCRLFDLKTLKPIRGSKLGSSITSIAFPHAEDSKIIYLSSGNQVHSFDLREPTPLILDSPSRSFNFSNDEINQVCLKFLRPHYCRFQYIPTDTFWQQLMTRES